MSSSPLQSLPPSSLWALLPTSAGVYIFKNAAAEVLYIGKAKNLRVRVRSYFQTPIRLGPKTQKLVSLISTSDHIIVNSEVEALLLESRLIKKFKPPFNIAAKDDTSPYFIHLTSESWPKPVITHIAANSLAGPFLNSLIPKRILRYFRRITPYCLAPRPVRRPCLYSHLGVCFPCPGLGNPALRPLYLKNLRRLKNLLRGHFVLVRSQLRQEMNRLAQGQEYETAAKIKLQLEALDYLLLQPVSPEEYLVNPNLVDDTRQAALQSLKLVLQQVWTTATLDLNRIEMFDVAHLSGTHATAAMTVATHGEINSSNFRHFKIKFAQTTNDVDMLQEILSRRLSRDDWPRPDLIVLDGGKAQLSIIPSIKKYLTSNPSPIPLIALSKQFETLVIPTEASFTEVNLPKDHPGLLLLMHLRDEAHRFSRRLHHHRRAKIISNA